ncbi:hypothetical protein GWI33_013769 [Rhynchophorus ferrugineus]|uniref:Lipase maturation factor n=1 Tax=Rhynchophorus ferrugineus TaxID=354439 RepID=A0A834M9N3_RHYFE|nr:hypothetical protein GWI33_013769 [Rhynchophorus ferrugineus]
MSGVIPVGYTRNLFLRTFCIVYLSAFLSFYYQAPGLYGDNGILPARSVLENSKHKTLSAKIHYQPTLLWLAPYLGLSTSAAVDVLSLLGAFLAFTGLVSQKFCIVPIFTALWSLYFSLYQIGQVFVTNNYDEFLLEAGFLAIFMAPFFPSRRRVRSATTDLISFWLCRWLVFRYLFSNGITKLLSGCPKWWTLTALNHHFETMPLPNPLSWYAHHLPKTLLQLSSVYTSVCELAVPFLFFLPIRGARFTAFHLIAFLQTCIVATGNFSYENILIMTLLLSLLDDKVFSTKKKPSSKMDFLDHTLTVGVWAGLCFGIYKLYGIKFSGGLLDAQIAFTKIQFGNFIAEYLQYAVCAILISLALTVLVCLAQVLFNKSYTGNKLFGILGTAFYTIIALSLFFSSTVPLISIHPKTNSTIHPTVRTTYNRLHKLRVVNQYGLFPKITGVEGRPEIILEGSNSLEGPWKEYSYLYKPGNVNHSLPFVVPYGPRLDWQFYWAAQSTYDKQPWVLSLAHRLLTSKPEVLILIDKSHSAFGVYPPKYIRGVLYKYKFTTNNYSGTSWWVREKVSEYFPPYAKDSPVLEDFLKARNLLPSGKPSELNPIWKQVLDSIRFVANQVEATLIFWSVFSAGLAIIATISGS